MKILHILDHYKPHFSGYVFRTSYILKYQKEFGLEPVIVTSPKHGHAEKPVEQIDKIRIYRTVSNDFGKTPFVKETRLMKTLQKRIEEVIECENPDVIHAHSPSLNGNPALRAGRKYGIPVVYEVRAFWEDAAVDHGTFAEGSLKYKISRFMETGLFKKVDALFTICEGLKKEMVSRGIPDDKVTVIPNCVDTEVFAPLEYDLAIADRYGLKDKIVYGFIGSFYHYEGLDILLDSYKNVIKKNSNTMLFLIGDGPARSALHEKTKQMGLLRNIIFTGKIPHQEIKRYYSVIDFLVYPRKSMRLTELVTPLKPLEAMAMGKVVVGSDVGGIKELVTHNKDGFLFKAGDINDLSRLLNDLAFNQNDTGRISKAAMETVHEKHKWDIAVKKYLPVYEKILSIKHLR
ncbi:MAG: glycosyltransferase, exosortase A system-associated [Nitrospira sp.]|nr:glycosyltransferase, exosortase A system-associated [Nitrospira sp.]